MKIPELSFFRTRKIKFAVFYLRQSVRLAFRGAYPPGVKETGASCIVVRCSRVKGIYANQMGGMDEPPVPDIQSDVGYAFLAVRPDSSEEKEVSGAKFPVRSHVTGSYSGLQFIDIHYFAGKNLLGGIPREQHPVQEIYRAGKTAAVE